MNLAKIGVNMNDEVMGLYKFKQNEEDIAKSLSKNNEICEVIYTGRVLRAKNIDQKHANKSSESMMMRRFLIRRKISLELMYTNGLCYQIDTIKGSFVHPPNQIQDICLSNDNSKLLAFISPVGIDT